MSNSDIEQAGTVKGHIPNRANLSGRISNVVSLSGHISIGGAGDFIIKMTVESDDNGNYTIASCDATIEQIDAAVAAEKRVVVIAYYNGIIFELPMLEGVKGSIYYFGMFLQGQVILSFVQKIGENENEWRFGIGQILSEDVGYSNAALPNISTVSEALDKIVPNSHTHTNKLVLDKFTETDGKPTYDGDALGSDFIIKMTVTSDDNGNYTVASCDATVEQIDAAVAAEKRIVVIATDIENGLLWEMPIIEGFQGENYYFGTFMLGQAILSFVQKISENEARWQFVVGQIGSDFISYSNDALPNISTVEDALNNLVPKSHTHTNKPVLDKFAESDGKPTYNGEKISGASTAEEVEYTNAILPNASNVKSALDDTIDTLQTQSADTESLRAGVSALMNAYQTQGGDIASLKTQAHTHANKDTLDNLSVTDGKLQYNGSYVGLKPVKGTDYWTAADKAEIVNDTLAALPTWTGGNY